VILGFAEFGRRGRYNLCQTLELSLPLWCAGVTAPGKVMSYCGRGPKVEQKADTSGGSESAIVFETDFLCLWLPRSHT